MNKRYGRVVVDMSDLSSLADSKMDDKTASTTHAAAMQRAKSLASRCLRRHKSSDEVNPQQDSPLFNQLPQELRDRIWEFAFAPPRYAKPAHFHIYDEVYDACTYQRPDGGVSKYRAELRKKQANIALLMSCRRIYQEALRYLYDEAKFTLVVFAGLPREHCKRKHSDRCKSLGKIRDCKKLFRTMRHLTLIIQPGKSPHTGLYTARINELLNVLDHGKRLLSLNLIFNYRLEINDEDPEHKRRRQIISALYPLRQQLTPRIAAGKCTLNILGWTDDTDSNNKDDPTLTQLLRILGAVSEDEYVLYRTRSRLSGSQNWLQVQPSRQPCRLITWDPMLPLDKKMCVRHGADMCCLERGAFGDNNKALTNLQPTVRPPAANRRVLPNVHRDDYLLVLYLAAGLTTLVAFSPVLAPVIAYGCVNRKKIKGEWK
jgi:hypothetical protein